MYVCVYVCMYVCKPYNLFLQVIFTDLRIGNKLNLLNLKVNLLNLLYRKQAEFESPSD